MGKKQGGGSARGALRVFNLVQINQGRTETGADYTTSVKVYVGKKRDLSVNCR